MPKFPRNAQCPCDSGKKYKRCCLIQNNENEKRIILKQRQLIRDRFWDTANNTLESSETKNEQ